MRVVILNAAHADVNALRGYICKNFSRRVWENTYSKLKTTIRNLVSFPYLGAIPDELARLHLSQYRQVLSGRNRIIYEVRQDVVYIHLIVDARRDMKEILLQRLLH